QVRNLGRCGRGEYGLGQSLDGLATRLIAIEEEDELLGLHAREQGEVAGGQRGGAEREGVLHLRLVQADAVEVALDEDRGLLLADLLARLIGAVERLALVVELALA